MTPSSFRSERGSMLPLTAGLLFVGFAMVALVVEIALLGAAYRDVATVADLAAEAAASRIATTDAYGDGIELDPFEAGFEARRVAAMWGSGDEIVAVDVAVTTVCVTVTDIYRPRTLAFIGVSTISVEVRSCASPRTG